MGGLERIGAEGMKFLGASRDEDWMVEFGGEGKVEANPGGPGVAGVLGIPVGA